MRKYNSQTDYWILEKAVKDRLQECPDIDNKVIVCGLSNFKSALNANGVEWPPNFNNNFDKEALALDKDICKVWGI